MNLTRRSVLAGTGAVSLGAVAGCLSEPDEMGNEGGYAAFFTLWDWANQVADGELEFENPVPAGEMGHGWEPDFDLTAEVASSEVFIYMDTPEFSWAQDIVAGLERDYGDNVTVIDAMSGMGAHLIPFGGGDDDEETDGLPEPDYDHEFDPDDIVRERFDFYDLRSEDQLGYWHIDHWHGGVPEVPVDGSVPIGAVFRDSDDRVVPLGENEAFQFDARLAEGAQEDVIEITSYGDYVELSGLETEGTEIVFELRHEDDLVYDTDAAPMTVDVVDGEGASEFHDPHVWVDPVLAQDAVSNIADGLAEIDPDNADLFEENAEAYNERLADIDQQFEQLAEDADREVVVFVGHDSYQYIARRYGLEFHTPTGAAPDASGGFDAVANLIDIVDEHDIDTILYDPFESADPSDRDELPDNAETLLEGSSATNAEPLSPVEGTTGEWDENDWGWVGQMEEINLPSLRKALDAE